MLALVWEVLLDGEEGMEGPVGEERRKGSKKYTQGIKTEGMKPLALTRRKRSSLGGGLR